MKKIFFLLIIIIFLFVGCTNNNAIDNNLNNTNNTNNTNNNVLPSQIYNKTNDIPQSYNMLIEDFKNIVDLRLSVNFDETYNNDINFDAIESKYVANNSDISYRWNCMIIEMITSIDKIEDTFFSYYFIDLNNDGIEEGIWLKNDKTILAVFSIVDDKVCLLDAFWPRYSCNIKDGKLYIISSDGAYYISYFVKQVQSQNINLETIYEFGTEESSQNISYYHINNNVKEIITEDYFNELKSNFN